MNYWRPVPQALIQELLMHRWSRESPAPDAVGYMVALDRMMAGAPFSARKLAEYCGWTRWHATQIQNSVREFRSEWDQPSHAAGSQPQSFNNRATLPERTGHEPATLQPETSHHAPGYTRTRTEQEHHSNSNAGVEDADSLVEAPSTGGGASSLASEPPIEKEAQPRTKSKPVDLAGMWERMEDVRLSVTPGGKRAQLGKRRDQLRARVSEHGEEAMMHCWEWLWQSDDQRARFLRDGGYGISTFLRAGKLRDYMDRAGEWDKSKQDEMGSWYTEDDFDENGNLRAP